MEDVASRIKELRLQADLTQAALGKLVGTSGVEISRLETGKRRLTLEWVTRLSNALNCETSEILGLAAPAQRTEGEVEAEALPRLLAAISRHWDALGTNYARNIFLENLYRQFPELQPVAAEEKSTKMV